MEDIMICVLVKIKVKENKQKQFEEIFINLSSKIRENEEGNIFYQVSRDKQNSLNYIIMENYKDIESIKKHSKSLHVKNARKLFKDCFDGEPIIRHFDAL
jgi:quinol monooxygenase YgiN|tara:strand:+ start:95 stop:394 length:300 start_codon:yes stop_codon:yes gene_type:complete